jgi:hypothetical protein
MIAKSRTCKHLASLIAVVAIGFQGAPASAQFTRIDAAHALHRLGTFKPDYGIQMLIHQEPPDDVPVRPIIHGRALSDEEYDLLKRRNVPSATFKPGIPPNRDFTMNPQVAGYVYETNALNAYQTFGWYPPDDSFAIGPTSAIQPANSAVGVFTRGASGLSLASLVDANTFMKFFPVTKTTDGGVAFDPRAMYDYKTGHFFIAFSAFPYQDASNNWHTDFLLAVSQTNDATGNWTAYALDYIAANPGLPTAEVPDLLFDYPDIGMDANNLYVTANIFGAKSFLGATLLVFDKAALEAGSSKVAIEEATGLNATLTPPYVWQQGKTNQSYFVFSDPGSVGPTSHTGYVGMYAVSGKAVDASVKISQPYGIVVPYYDVAGSAEQPGFWPLDSLDTRFQDKTTQWAENLYATHCVSLLGYPMVTAYEFNGNYGTLVQTVNLISSPTSCDFNPSIAVNSSGMAVVNWNATDISKTVAADNVYESVRSCVLGRAWGTQPKAGTLVPGGTSSQYYYGYRNGDYSMTMLDPLNSNLFWGIDQTVYDPYDWNTYLFELSVK